MFPLIFLMSNMIFKMSTKKANPDYTLGKSSRDDSKTNRNRKLLTTCIEVPYKPTKFQKS